MCCYLSFFRHVVGRRLDVGLSGEGVLTTKVVLQLVGEHADVDYSAIRSNPLPPQWETRSSVYQPHVDQVTALLLHFQSDMAASFDTLVAHISRVIATQPISAGVSLGEWSPKRWIRWSTCCPMGAQCPSLLKLHQRTLRQLTPMVRMPAWMSAFFCRVASCYGSFPLVCPLRCRRGQ
jgi:hypothetical protein